MPEQSKTVDEALEVLTALAAIGPTTPGELARRLAISPTAVRRLLVTLEAHDIARRTAQGWAPGLALVTLASGVERTIRAAARSHLSALAEATHATAVLTVPAGLDAVALDEVVGVDQLVEVRYRPGLRHRLDVTAHGLALLSASDQATVAAVGASPAIVDQVREAGYAITRGQLEPGVAGVAAVVTDLTGAPVASIGVVLPDHRLIDDAAVAATVVAAAHALTSDLSATTANHRAIALG